MISIRIKKNAVVSAFIKFMYKVRRFCAYKIR
jgi:hypothetical protein